MDVKATEFGGGVVPEEINEVINEYYRPRLEEADEGDVHAEPVYEDEEDDIETEVNSDVSEPELSVGNDVTRSFLETEDEQKFLDNGCDCDKECVKLFDRLEIMEHRINCKENDSRDEDHVNYLDTLVLGALHALTNTSAVKGEGRLNYSTDYRFLAHQVCRTFFTFAFGIGQKRLQNLKEHYIKKGVEPRIYGNVGKKKGLSFETKTDVINFINNYASQHALVLPGRVPGTRVSSIKLLPCSMPKSSVHVIYKNACNEIQKEPVLIRTWYRLWDELCPNVVVQKPRSDLCVTCHRNTLSLSHMNNLDEEKRLELISKSHEHLIHVMEERNFYKSAVDVIMADVKLLGAPLQLGRHPECDYVGKMHYSFDFAQQVHLPHSSQQTGPLFFLTGYKVALFGVACEPLGQFVLYIIPESVVSGKGSNTVISLLHHFLENYGVGETESEWHADNCAGQNKNNFLFQYAAWRIMTQKHKKISISFLPPGHTKFAPDLYFGIFKRKFSKSTANTVQQLLEVAETSCRQSDTIIVCATGNENGDVLVKTYDWQVFFRNENPNKIPGISKYYHFEVTEKDYGYVSYGEQKSDLSKGTRIFCEDEVFFDPLLLPTEIVAPGLSTERKKYLHDKIRPYVDNEFKDILCPLPAKEVSTSVPNKLQQISNDNVVIEPDKEPQMQDAGLGASGEHGVGSPVLDPIPLQLLARRKIHCGYCHEEGHRNFIRRGVPDCPKRRNTEAAKQP